MEELTGKKESPEEICTWDASCSANFFKIKVTLRTRLPEATINWATTLTLAFIGLCISLLVKILMIAR